MSLGSLIVKPGLTIATLHCLEIPLRGPFETASGRVTVRSIGLVSVSRDGTTGWGEAAPYPGQDEPFGDVVVAARTGAMTPTLAAAMDEALRDLVARERGVSLSSELGATHATVPVSVAVGMGDDVVGTVEEAWRSGVRRFKVKIVPGRTSHVADIRRLFPEAVLGADGNGSFDATTSHEILALAGLDLAFVEEPSATVDDSVAQRLREAGFTVFMDESIRSVSDAEQALASPGVSGIVVKPGRLGWNASVEVVRMARVAGRLWRASGLLETGVGRSFSLALAASSDAFISDIAPASWFFSYDVASQPIVEGELVVPTGPGTGIDIDVGIVSSRTLEVIPLSGSVIPDLG